MHIIAWQYDADRYCTDCTERKYPGSTSSQIDLPYDDSEGNPIAPLFTWDEWHEPSIAGCQILACGDCHEILDVTHDPDCTDYLTQVMNEYGPYCIDIDGDVECPYCGHDAKYARDGVIYCPCKQTMNDTLRDKGAIA